MSAMAAGTPDVTPIECRCCGVPLGWSMGRSFQPMGSTAIQILTAVTLRCLGCGHIRQWHPAPRAYSYVVKFDTASITVVSTSETESPVED